MLRIHILFPVLNEHKRLVQGIEQTVAFMEQHFPGEYKITIVDNGSTDDTPQLSLRLTEKYPTVHYLQLSEKGVGLALREGVRGNDCEIVGYMDIDLSTKIDHILQMNTIFEENPEIQIVNGSRISKGSTVIGRKLSREMTSRGLNLILKVLLGMKIDDSLCGFKFFRKKAIETLISHSSDTKGWFYCAEILLRAEREKVQIREIPVVWQDDYNTTVHVKKLIVEYLKEIFRLWVEFRKKPGHSHFPNQDD